MQTNTITLQPLTTASLSIQQPAQVIHLELAQALRGEKGADGASGYTHTQADAAYIWTVPHNLHKYPTVTVYNNLGEQIFPDVAVVDTNIIQISHAVPTQGTAILV